VPASSRAPVSNSPARVSERSTLQLSFPALVPILLVLVCPPLCVRDAQEVAPERSPPQGLSFLGCGPHGRVYQACQGTGSPGKLLASDHPLSLVKQKLFSSLGLLESIPSSNTSTMPLSCMCPARARRSMIILTTSTSPAVLVVPVSVQLSVSPRQASTPRVSPSSSPQEVTLSPPKAVSTPHLACVPPPCHTACLLTGRAEYDGGRLALAHVRHGERSLRRRDIVLVCAPTRPRNSFPVAGIGLFEPRY
jgi:hypothetical protein